MPIPVRGVLFPAGSGGAPSTANPQRVPSLDSYEHTIVNEGGFESAQLEFRVPTSAAAEAYLSLLMAGVLMTGPHGQTVWEGFVQEVTVDLGGETNTRNLVDMANRIVVRYKDADGKQTSATPATDAASIARYGTKTRLINLSTASATAAANRAAVVLTKRKEPARKRDEKTATGKPSTGYQVTLICRGWWDTLGWLLTSSTSTTMTQTSTQVLTLLTAYCATNPFFSLSTANITATGVSDVETIEEDSTYLEAITTKLASGNAAQQPVVYGVYEGRRLSIRPWAGATPDTIKYHKRKHSPTVRDAYGTVVDPWDVRPDAMVLMPGRTGAEAETFYCKRVRCKLSRSDQDVVLEPDEPEGVAEILTQPAGAASSGTSARQAAVERTIARQASTRFSGTNGKVDLGGGKIDHTTGRIELGPGGSNGTIDLGGGGSIDTGGGAIGNTGGGNVDLGTGTGIGVGNPSGTRDNIQAAPRDAKYWLSAANSELSAEVNMSALGSGLLKQSVSGGVATPAIAVAGTDYVVPGTLAETIDDQVAGLLQAGSGISLTYNDAGGTLTIAVANLNETIDDRVAALLTEGAGITITYNDASNTLTIAAALTAADVGAAPSDVKYIVQQATSALSAEQALGALASGILKNTTSTGVLSIAVAGTDYAAASHTHTSTDITNFAEAVDDRVDALLVAGTGITITYNDASNTLTIAASGGLSGTGIAPSGSNYAVAFWDGTSSLDADASGLIYNPTSNRLGIGTPTPARTLDVNGSAIIGGGIVSASLGSALTTASGQIKATDSVAIGGSLVVGSTTISGIAGAITATSEISTTGGGITTSRGVTWDLGGYTATVLSIVGYATVDIGGVTRKVAIVN